MAQPLMYVPAPAGRPLPFGLLSAAVMDDQADGPWEMGTQYEPDYCGPALVTEGACRVPDLGSASVSVDNARLATITMSGFPAGAYTITWGDTQHDDADTSPSGNTNTYAADGVYVVTVTGPGGYRAQGNVTVTNGAATGPFDLTVSHVNVPTSGIDVVEGFPFAVYSILDCKAVGIWGEVANDRVRTMLTSGEGRAVETVLAHQMATDTDAVDLTPTPGTAVHPVTGLAILEGWAAENYGGSPTIHTPRSVGTLLYSFRAIDRQGQALETGQGSRVASGGGYEGMQGPDTTDPGAGEAWLYVTGTVLLRRASTPRIDEALALDTPTNQQIARAIRPYVVSWECIVGAVLVTADYQVPA